MPRVNGSAARARTIGIDEAAYDPEIVASQAMLGAARRVRAARQKPARATRIGTSQSWAVGARTNETSVVARLVAANAPIAASSVASPGSRRVPLSAPATVASLTLMGPGRASLRGPRASPARSG